VVLMDAAPIVPRDISSAESVLRLTTLLGAFLRILVPPAKSKILPTGDFFLDDAGRFGLACRERVLGISSVSTCLSTGEGTVSGKGVGDAVEDRGLKPSKIVVSLFRREGSRSCGGCSGTRNTAYRGDFRTDTSSLVRTVSAVLEPDERGEEIALRNDAVVLLGVGHESLSSFKTL
jgi:hypothetical protein